MRGSREGNLEEGTVRALSPQALRTRFVLAVRLVDLQVLHLQQEGGHENEIRSVTHLTFQDFLMKQDELGGEVCAHPL